MVTVTLNLAGAGEFCLGAVLLAGVAWVVNVTLNGYHWRKKEEELIGYYIRRGEATPEQLQRWRSIRRGVQTFLPVAKPFAALGWVIAGWRTK